MSVSAETIKQRRDAVAVKWEEARRAFQVNREQAEQVHRQAQNIENMGRSLEQQMISIQSTLAALDSCLGGETTIHSPLEEMNDILGIAQAEPAVTDERKAAKKRTKKV